MDKDDMDEMDFLRDDLDAAKERIAYLEKAYKELHRDTTAMMGEDKERIKVLEDALRKLEWSGYDDYMQASCCPICHADIRTSWKHKPDCLVGAALEVKP